MAQTITEGTRFALQSRAREVLGEQEGDTLMAHLPPVGWADVATKQDLEVVSGQIEALRVATSKDIEVSRLATKADMEQGFRRQTTWVASVLGAQTAMWAGLVTWMISRLPAG
jgi:hypothetical protein